MIQGFKIQARGLFIPFHSSPSHLSWLVHSEQPPYSQKCSFGKETGELVRG